LTPYLYKKSCDYDLFLGHLASYQQFLDERGQKCHFLIGGQNRNILKPKERKIQFSHFLKERGKKKTCPSKAVFFFFLLSHVTKKIKPKAVAFNRKFFLKEVSRNTIASPNKRNKNAQ